MNEQEILHEMHRQLLSLPDDQQVAVDYMTMQILRIVAKTPLGGIAFAYATQLILTQNEKEPGRVATSDLSGVCIYNAAKKACDFMGISP